jgi:hypothetical protein
MSKSPIIETMDGFLAKLKDAVQQRNELQSRREQYTTAIRALAQTCEDENVKGDYLTALDELSSKPGFVSAIRTLLSAHPDGLTPGVIKIAIQQAKLMDLTNYSNPAASIHTTLRRMVDSKEVESFVNETGEKAYRFNRVDQKLRDAIGRNPRGRTVPPPPGAEEKVWPGYPDPMNKRGPKK